MTNGDRIRMFSNEQIALVLMCPIEAMLADEDEITCLGDAEKAHDEHTCARCIYGWLNKEEASLD